jgi:CRISPR-associated protein (TIGR02584 family)
MTNINPVSYPHRVLIVVSGESPQVITETIYALSTLPQPFVPTQVVVVTTAVGAQRVRDSLLDCEPGRGQFFELCTQYGLNGIAFAPAGIRVSTDETGQQDQDAHTEAELMRMGDLMLATLCEFASDDTAIHLSLAGGRKTMSYYAGQAMNLVARPQDRLSHVILSDKRFEFSPDFYFPPKVPVILEVRDRLTGKVEKLSTADVKVRIADVPFLRLRELLGKKALVDVSNPRRLSDLIEEANVALVEPGDAVVEFDTHGGRVWCNGRLVPFSQVELAFYYALAALAEDDRALTRRASDEECLEYLELRSYVTEEGMTLRKKGKYEATVQDAFDSLFGVRDFLKPTKLSDLVDPGERRLLLGRRADVLNPQFTNVNKRLIETLGSVMAQRFICQSSGRPNAAYYLPDGVRIVWRDRRPRKDL